MLVIFFIGFLLMSSTWFVLHTLNNVICYTCTSYHILVLSCSVETGQKL